MEYRKARSDRRPQPPSLTAASVGSPEGQSPFGPSAAETNPLASGEALLSGLAKPKFTLFKGNDGQFYWNFKAPNSERLCHSEGYTTKQSALNGIRSLKDNINLADISDLT